MIRLVSFDMWSTLVHPNQYVLRRWVETLAWAIGSSDLAAVEVAMGRAEHRLHDRMLSSGQTFGFAEHVAEACAELDADVPDIDDLYTRLHKLSNVEMAYAADSGARMMLLRLKAQGYKTAVIGTAGFFDGSLMRLMLERIGLYECMDYELFSDVIGVAKPSPQVFERLQELSGIPAHQILHVGDDLAEDCQAAQAAGLRALHYTPGTDDTATSFRHLWALPDHPALKLVTAAD